MQSHTRNQRVGDRRQLRARSEPHRRGIFHGDALRVLRTLETQSIDLVCTDPPYGIGFMGKAWDKALPEKEVFEECLRVLKPGGFAFVMCAPRSDVCARMMLMLEAVGFDIGFTPIYWTYASGFPKATNIGKAVDKREGRERVVVGRNPNSRENATIENSLYKPGTVGKTACITKGSHPLEGSYGGFQPKPALEVIVVAMKPLSEKTFVAQALKNGKGITWLDDCRIPIDSEIVRPSNAAHECRSGKNRGNRVDGRLRTIAGHECRDRFPANVLVSGAALGEHSRFFSLDAVAAKSFPFLIVPKASKREKNSGLSGFNVKLRAELPPRSAGARRGGGNDGGETERIKATQNIHPTVKPLALLSYLITLGSRQGDVVLDPFLGSGTTAVAAKFLKRRCIGIEREREYHALACARVNAASPSRPF